MNDEEIAELATKTFEKFRDLSLTELLRRKAEHERNKSPTANLYQQTKHIVILEVLDIVIGDQTNGTPN